MIWFKKAFDFLTSNMAILFTAIGAAMYGVIKYLSQKVDRLETQLEVEDDIKEIREEQNRTFDKHTKEAEEANEQRKKDLADKSVDDIIDGL